MILRELKRNLMGRDESFLGRAEIVYLEIFSHKFLKLKDDKGYTDDSIYDIRDITNELETRENVFVRYRNDTTECNIEDY